MTELKLTREELQALEFHFPTLRRRQKYLLERAQNGAAFKEVAAITFIISLLCPVVEGCNDNDNK